MSDDTFYNKVRETMYSYAPEVPASVYTGMRRKLWLAKFLSFGPERLNIWYLLLAGGVAVAAISQWNTSCEPAMKANYFESEITLGSAGAPTPNACGDSSTMPAEQPSIARVKQPVVQSNPSDDLVVPLADAMIDQPGSSDATGEELNPNQGISDEKSADQGAKGTNKVVQEKGKKLRPPVYRSK